MAEKLASPIGSLAEGAQRLEQLIRGVKDRQFSEASNAPQPKSVANAFAVSPEETWSKQFMTAGIGPTVFKPVQMPVVSVAAPAAATVPMPSPKTLEPVLELTNPVAPERKQAAPRAPELVAAFAPEPKPAAEPRPAPKAAAPSESPGALRPAPIGAAIAKPARKKTWFGRLVKS
ncbi:MAG TPA: hypothetical protein VG387_00885 [Rhizomicrobium sp.]|jgi:hypothetical protein|nr:hypothetical protein [Rhizomicrobium sp.]